MDTKLKQEPENEEDGQFNHGNVNNDVVKIEGRRASYDDVHDESEQDETLWFCLVCNQPCLMDSMGTNHSREDHQNQEHEFDSLGAGELKELIFNAFEIEVDEKASSSFRKLPLCSGCIFKCGQLKYITLQMEHLEREYNRLREEMAFSVVDLVASNAHVHNYYDEKDQFNSVRQVQQNEIEAVQQFIFDNWHERYPTADESETDSTYNLPLPPIPSPRKFMKGEQFGSNERNLGPGNKRTSNAQLTISSGSNKGGRKSNDGKSTLISITTSDVAPSTSAGERKVRRRVPDGNIGAHDSVRRMPHSSSLGRQIVSRNQNVLGKSNKQFRPPQNRRPEYHQDNENLEQTSRRFRPSDIGEDNDGDDDYNSNLDGENETGVNHWDQGEFGDQSSNPSQSELLMDYDYLSSLEGGHFMEGGYGEPDPLENMEDESVPTDVDIDYQQNADGFYVCTYCNKQFIHKYPYRDHLKTHTGEGPKCPICSKIFPKNHNLMLHMRTHTGEKPFKCEVCRKGFADKSNLKVHMRVHTGERPYQCECGLSFVNSSRLVVHRRLHTGEKPFPCDLCHRRFGSSNQLHSHRKTHFTNQSPQNTIVNRKIIRRNKIA